MIVSFTPFLYDKLTNKQKTAKKGEKKQVKKIQMTVFDWAGTTVDYGCVAPLAVFEKIFEDKKIRLSREEILKPMGMGKRDHIETLLSTENATQQWKEQYKRDWDQRDVDEMFSKFNAELLKVFPEYCTLIDGVIETIEALRKENIVIGSTTGYTREMMDIVEKGAKDQGYAPDYVVTSEMTGYGRPFPYMLFENMRKFEVYPPCCVVKVGDTASDMKEGKNAGAWSVGIIEGSSATNLTPELAATISEDEKKEHFIKAKQILEDAGADYVIQTIRDLPGVIEEINKKLEEF